MTVSLLPFSEHVLNFFLFLSQENTSIFHNDYSPLSEGSNILVGFEYSLTFIIIF